MTIGQEDEYVCSLKRFDSFDTVYCMHNVVLLCLFILRTLNYLAELVKVPPSPSIRGDDTAVVVASFSHSIVSNSTILCDFFDTTLE